MGELVILGAVAAFLLRTPERRVRAARIGRTLLADLQRLVRPPVGQPAPLEQCLRDLQALWHDTVSAIVALPAAFRAASRTTPGAVGTRFQADLQRIARWRAEGRITNEEYASLVAAITPDPTDDAPRPASSRETAQSKSQSSS